MKYYYYSILAVILVISSCTRNINFTEEGSVVRIENEYTALSFDQSTGTYSVSDKISGLASVSGAKLRINNWKSDDEGVQRTWESHSVNDEFGEGMALEVFLEKEGMPKMIFTFTLYNDYDFINVNGGIENTLDTSIQVKEIYAISEGKLYPGTDVSENFAMVDGFSGGEPLEYGKRMYSPLTRKNGLRSRNNILFTFTRSNEREIAVLGGLTYQDFEKFAFIEQPRRKELLQGEDGENSLLCYLNFPDDRSDQQENGEILTLEQGEGEQVWQNHEFRCQETATSLKSPEDVVVSIKNANPDKSYILGFSWWNGYWHGDHEDNTQSVYVEYVEDGKRKKYALFEGQRLPRFDGVKKEDIEQVEFRLPSEVADNGNFRVVFSKANKSEKDQNVYLSEVWLRDGSFEPLLSDELTSIAECLRPRIEYKTSLFAKDPVGKRVDPGVVYKPFDSFYIDVVDDDPFLALEDYGKSVSKAQDIDLSMYDFPSVCLWYAEVDYYGGGKAENSTFGAVNEMKQIAENGFLKYSRAAVRLVPDSYMPDNQQGWWDDEHWQREDTDLDVSKNGRYIEPYETSEKWGKAVTDLGGIPLTYFQASFRSEDYAKAFPEHMLFNKTYAWKGNPVDTTGEIFTTWNGAWTRSLKLLWGYDYTDPEFLNHLTDVYANLKKGNIQGLMFDYPFSGWASAGGMEDKYSTTAAAYRNIFKYPHEGLGPNAYVHERNMQKGSDVTIGFVASMRTENDTDVMDSTTVTRCGMRWYKNRVIYNQDTDSKNIARLQDNRDNVRAVLTMAYVVTGRLLLANSFVQFSPETYWDITRTFPYHTENKSARPVDAFVSPSPTVYDFEVNEKWHQVTFYNPDMEENRVIGIDISGEPVNGALYLQPDKSYYVYDFWNDNYVGKFQGTQRLEQELRPAEARMLSVREVLDRPQVISTDRHIMQGYLDIVSIEWNDAKNTLQSVSKIVGEDPYVITIATNGLKAKEALSESDDVSVAMTSASEGLIKVTLTSDTNREAKWSVVFEK